MVPTKFDKSKIASLVNFVMPLKGQRGFSLSILLILFSDGIKSRSVTRSRAGKGWCRQQLPLLCSPGCYFCAVAMQVYCSKLAAAEQRVCTRLWFLTLSRGNREGRELCTKLRLLVPEVHTLKATVIGTLGHECADNGDNLSKCK